MAAASTRLHTLETKLAAVQAFLAKATTKESIAAIAARAGCSEPTIYYWANQHAEGKLKGAAAPAQEETPIQVERKKYTLEFKREAVRQYKARGGMPAAQVSSRLGLGRGVLTAWVAAEADGRLSGTPHASHKTNGHGIVKAKAHAPAIPKQQVLELGEMPSFHAENARLAANNTMLKKFVYMMLEQL